MRQGWTWLILETPDVIYALNTGFVTARMAIGSILRAYGSQKSEPGRPRLAIARPAGDWKGTRFGLRGRQQHGVDHVDDAVGLVHVGDRDHRLIALGVDDPGLAVGLLDGEFLALDGLQLLAVGEVGGVKLAGDHMVGEDFGQGRLVLGDRKSVV